MKVKQKSLRVRVITFCVISATVIVLMFLVYGMYNTIRYRSDFINTNTMVTQFYRDELEYQINSLDAYIGDIYAENTSYRILLSDSLSEMGFISAEYYLHDMMKGKAESLGKSGGLFYYNARKNSMRSAFQFQETTDAGEEYRLNQLIKKWVADNMIYSEYSEILQLEGKCYYLKLKGNEKQVIGFCLNLSDYFKGEASKGEFQIAITDREGNVYCETGKEIIPAEEIKEAFAISYTNGFHYVIVKDCMKNGLTIVMVRSYWGYLRFWRDPKIIMFLVAIPLIAIVPFVILYRYINYLLVVPTSNILEKIKNGNQFEKSTQDIVEFKEMEDHIAEMIQTSNQLTQEIYESRLEKSRMRMQNYQLQLKPHFYLNCLKSMYAYIDKGNTDKVKVFILRLASYLRSRFQELPPLIPLKDELDRVEDYYVLTNIMSELPMILRRHIDTETEQIMVPALSIQTLIENAYKYAKIPGKPLMIDIYAKMVDENLNIIISDNGNGFPQESISRYNSREHLTFNENSSHIGIMNLKYRFQTIYGNKAELLFYNGPAGGAFIEMMIPGKDI